MNETNKKRLKTTASATLAAALLVTGSLAWRDVSQHKTNKFSTKSVSQSMVLVEKFKDKDNWIPGEAVQKEVYVRNGQDTDDTDKYVYSDGYVRIQLREFLGKMEENIEWTAARYLIDTNGNHVKATTHAGAKAAALAMGYKVDDSQIYQVSTPMDGTSASEPGNGGYNVPADTKAPVVQHEGTFSPNTGYYYVRTDENAPNGIYGKFIMITNKAKNNLTNYVDGSAVNLTDLDKDKK